MNITTILIIVNVFAAVAIIALVLMQQSKGDMGSAFGGGGSASMFGSKGSANFLTRCTSTMVVIFFASSLTLAYIYAKRNAAEQEIVPISVEQSSEVPSIDSVVEEQSSDIPTIDAQELDDAINNIDTEAPVAP
jgi:preprotein translocase subunit SecG